MEVTNAASFPVKAIAVYNGRGGKEVTIQPGQSVEVSGPILTRLEGGRKPTILVPGKITCHEGPDGAGGFHIARGEPVQVADEDNKYGMLVRHHEDE